MWAIMFGRFDVLKNKTDGLLFLTRNMINTRVFLGIDVSNRLNDYLYSLSAILFRDCRFPKRKCSPMPNQRVPLDQFESHVLPLKRYTYIET